MTDSKYNCIDTTYNKDLNMYCREVSKYPLLTKEQELRFGQMLQNPTSKKLLIVNELDGFDITNLNIPLLFSSLINSSLCKMIIDCLLSFYCKLDNKNEKVVSTLQKYQMEYIKLKRPLNKMELYQLFGINDSAFSILNDEEILLEVKKYIQYVYAFNKLFLSNLRLVISIANLYKGKVDISDLINEGNLGLIKAVQRYDSSLGNRFSTYAIWWIKVYIRRAVINYSDIVRLPEYMQDDVKDFKRKVNKLEQQFKRSLSQEEIAKELSLPVDLVRKYFIYMQEILSIDEEVNKDDSFTMMDMIQSNYNVEDMVLAKTLQTDINKVFDALTDREKMVIKMRFGIGEYKGKKYQLDSIGKILSVSRQRVMQIEEKALLKMKRYIRTNEESHSLVEYLRK